MRSMESMATVLFVDAILLTFPLNTVFSSLGGDPSDNGGGDVPDMSSMPEILALKLLIAPFHPSACTSPVLHPKFCVHCCSSSGYSMFNEPDMAMNWQNETTSHTDGESEETVDAVA